VTIELAELEHPATSAPPPEERANRLRWIVLAATLVVWVVLGWILQGVATQELPVSTLTDFQVWLNDLRDSIANAKNDGNPIFLPLDWITNAIDWVYTQLEQLFVSDESRPLGVAQIGWAGVVALAAWIAFALAGLRLAILSLVVFLAFGYLGYWEESVATLIITGISVVICVLIGLPLGIWMSRSQRATAWITPVLDTMQTMPSFAYLAPLVLLFAIGPPAAVVSTLIYALPPLVRISAHGLRTVSPTTMEATTALGSTSNQLLTKVQLPMARRTIIVGLNQTIMAALSMAIIAAFIGGPGLGVPIVRALSALNVGVAFVAGMCIVLMAIMLDRGTVAASERSEARGTSTEDGNKRRKLILGVTGGAAAVIVYISNSQLRWNIFPETDLGTEIAGQVNDWVASFVDSFGSITKWISDTVTEWFLNPLDDLLANAPWWLVAAMILMVAATLGGVGRGTLNKVVAGCGAAGLAVLAAGYWAANTPDVSWVLYWGAVLLLLVAASLLGSGGALFPTAICLCLIFGVGLWEASMVTLAMTLVATVMVMVLGVLIGVWMGRSRRVDAIVRPFLDGLQTMPPLVYLVPALALFPVGRFLGIVAAVLYAAPVAIKIAADGVRAVSATTVEAAHSLGSSRWQMIRKVQLPMSKGSIVLAANQGLLFVLSMVVIGGLVGGGGLGFLVINGFSQREDFGKGLAAGIAITALGIMLDRITVHTAARYGRAEN
jgi:glycine betaine/proline transport system permease protein